MTAQAVMQYLADESCPESVCTPAQLKEEESAFFRIAAPGFTTGELWLAGPGHISSPSCAEEGGRLEEEPIMPTTPMATQEQAPMSQDGRLSQMASYLRGLYGRLFGTPVTQRCHGVGGPEMDSSDHLISPCCGKWLEKELWSLLNEEERLESQKAALRRFWSYSKPKR